MGCLFEKDIIKRSLSGEIEPLEKVFLEEHLKQCGECRDYLKALRAEKRDTAKKPHKLFMNMPKKEEPSIDTKKAELIDQKRTKKSMGVFEIALRGATAGVRAIPFKAIGKNLLKKEK